MFAGFFHWDDNTYKPRMQSDISLEEVRECLLRSGYVMESRIVERLHANNFFVEPNVAHKDPRTGKSREVDLVAEPIYANSVNQCVARTKFVLEAINNRFPVVLMTERHSTPNADFESYLKFGTTPVDLCPDLDVYELKKADWENLYSQYCQVTRKKDGKELMASHPDDMYSSLLKLAEYTEETLLEFNNFATEDSGTFWRMFFYHPILVVSEQLLVARLTEHGDLHLEDAQIARLEFNWHDGELPKTTIIEVIREDHLITRLQEINEIDRHITARLGAARGPVPEDPIPF